MLGFRHVYYAGVFNITSSLKAVCLEQPLGTGKARGTHGPGTGGDPLSARIQLTGNQRSRLFNDLPYQFNI